LDGGRLGRVLGVHDPLSAIIAAEAGVDALWVSSFGVSASCFGLPDTGVITMSEMIAVAGRIRLASGLPVIMDADTGYGGLLNVRRLTREARHGGLDAICIEDAEFPKRNSFLDARYRHLVSARTMCGRVRMVRETRADAGPLLLARTEVLTQGGTVDEALDRAHAYADAGADAVVVQSTRTDGADIFAFAERWRGRRPLVVIPTAYPQVLLADLHAAGVAAVILANQLLRAAHRAMREVCAALASAGKPSAVEGQISAMTEIHRTVGVQRDLDHEERIERWAVRPTPAPLVDADPAVR
jgi:phosphoenolpyruvate phosphomutase